jgi:3',5'-cyclic-AMP phosphodiesterase
MRFVILSDIHLGPEESYKGIVRKISRNVKPKLDNFIEEMNQKTKPGFVMVLGDLIQDENQAADKENVTYLAERMRALECPVYYAAGNHDLRNLSEQEFSGLLSMERLFYSFDEGSYHFIVLFSKRYEDGIRFHIPEEQVKWLKEDLKESDRECIIFVHYGLADQDLAGNPWFEGRPEKCLIKNREEVRGILSKSGKVIAAFNSHLHWDRMHLHDGIPYFTIQSFVENEQDKGVPSEAYALVQLSEQAIEVNIKGIYQKKFIHMSTR